MSNETATPETSPNLAGRAISELLVCRVCGAKPNEPEWDAVTEMFGKGIQDCTITCPNYCIDVSSAVDACDDNRPPTPLIEATLRRSWNELNKAN